MRPSRSAESSAPELSAAEQESRARTILLDQLTGRARSRAELAEKLAARDVPEAVATALLDRFAEVGLVDDAAFARTWVEQRHAGKGLARRALAHELRRKGIDEETAREALSEVADDDEAEAARQVVRSRLRSVQGLPREKAVRRLVGALARKGHAPGVAYAVVREELGVLDDPVEES